MSVEAAMFKSDPDEPVYAAAADEPAADEPADVTVAVADVPAGNAECCKKECLSRFDDEFKTSLKSAMASLSRSEKRVHLFTMIDVDAEKRDSCKKTTDEKWPWCYRYTVKEYGVRRLVCRQAFATLHDTSVQVVRLLCTQMPERHLVPVEKRGKHPSSKALPVHIQELIKDHVLSVLHTPNNSEYLQKASGFPIKKKLWISFLDKHGSEASEFSLTLAKFYKYVKAILTPDVLSEVIASYQARKIYKLLYTDKENKTKIKKEI